jgi:TolA-binding protein
MRVRLSLVLALLGGVASAGGAEPLQAPAPLVAAIPDAPSTGENVVTLLAAQRAQEMGFPSAAAVLYRRLLEAPASPGATAGGTDRATLTLGLATALLDDGQPAEAQQVLNQLASPRNAGWHLRAGLAAAELRQFPTAKSEAGAVHANDLPAADRGWMLYLQGTIARADGDHDKAKEFFTQAIEAAGSAQARARFLLRREQTRMRSGSPPSEADAEKVRRNVEQFQGRAVGYGFAQTYAVMLDALGRRSEAVALLRRQLMTLPAEERGELDQTRLLLGLIAGAAEGEGRNALERLLDRGSDRDKQRIALQLLARASTRNPQLAAFRHELDELIGAKSPHPILEDLLLFRAQVALAAARSDRTSEGYAQAEDDARSLLQRFPGSPLKAHAYGVLTESAWDQHRYRTAADNAAKARAALAAGPERAALGVLVAEAWYRARDYRSAADAYAAALREPPTGIAPGELMFQRVLAEIQADAPENAATVLDTLARDAQFDPINRWQAEWNLARALEAHGHTAEAFARVNRLLTEPGRQSLPAELRARMSWLQARLSFAAGQPEQTLTLVADLGASVAAAPGELRNEIASSSELLRAEASFSLGRDAAALEILKRLRADFPRSDAAVYSYFDEAEYYAKQDKTVEAQQLLTKLADDFPRHAYAPLALFQAALQAERRGQDANYREANRLIEDLVNKYADSDLVFAARLKQGDLLRKLNDFPAAQRVYELLVNKYPQRRDVALAQLALAETHNAQSANEPARAESAIVLFEHVRDRVDAPLDARVEAGFNLGYMRARRGETAKAQEIWWRDVVHAFLLQPAQASQLGDKGRYWMTRTLIELGALYEQQEKLEQAKQAWLLIITSKLGYGEGLARARLARFDLAEAKP